MRPFPDQASGGHNRGDDMGSGKRSRVSGEQAWCNVDVFLKSDRPTGKMKKMKFDKVKNFKKIFRRLRPKRTADLNSADFVYVPYHNSKLFFDMFSITLSFTM